MDGKIVWNQADDHRIFPWNVLCFNDLWLGNVTDAHFVDRDSRYEWGPHTGSLGIRSQNRYFSIYLEKAPGPDGMTTLFYQKLWNIFGPQVVKIIQEFMEMGNIEVSINEVNICLIPKGERPRAIKEFRPISLCNVTYKIFSKVLCQRLQQILPKLVSKSQSAFVAWRVISNNILVSQEAFHVVVTKNNCKKNSMAIKTDMSKAYDRVEWCFLEALMQKRGFTDIMDFSMCEISVISHPHQRRTNGAMSPTRGYGKEISSPHICLSY